MLTRQLPPNFVLAIVIFVLALGGLALLGCGNQTQVSGSATQASNQTLSRIDSVSDASDAAVAPGSSTTADTSSASLQRHAAQFVLSNPRQRVLSSGFPVSAY